jgi:large subunit ribosomal protein L15
MLTLNDLAPQEGARRNKKRVGRGNGSGHGKTACRGSKGQKARTGGNIEPGFEGGQMPLYRKLPKRGFKNSAHKTYGVVNLTQLNEFQFDSVIDLEALKKHGLIKKRFNLLKILGDGEINRAITIKADAISDTAATKIKAAGGQIDIVTK